MNALLGLNPANEPALLRQSCFVGGRWLDSDSGAGMPVHNPANGAVVAEVPFMGTTETRRAIEAAALPRWSNSTGRERAHRMRALYELILAQQEELAVILTLEQGKPIGQARAEIIYGASYLEWYAEEAQFDILELLKDSGCALTYLELKRAHR